MEEGWPGYYAACYENNCAQPPFVHEMQRYNAEYYHDLQVAYYEAMERDNSWYRRESIRQQEEMRRSALISRVLIEVGHMTRNHNYDLFF